MPSVIQHTLLHMFLQPHTQLRHELLSSVCGWAPLQLYPSRVFQRDLVKMRLETARALVKVLTDGQVGSSGAGAESRRGPRNRRIHRTGAKAAPCSRSLLQVQTFPNRQYSLPQTCVGCCVFMQGTHAAAASLNMSVNIQGLGPRFRLLINLANEGQDLATNLQVCLYAQHVGNATRLQLASDPASVAASRHSAVE
jgi:hypothetical protein